MSTKTVVRNALTGMILNVEVAAITLDDSADLHLYGNVDGDIDDIGDNGQPTGFTYTVSFIGASYWPTPTTALAVELGSLEAVLAATGMTAEEVGDRMIEAYTDEMDEPNPND